MVKPTLLIVGDVVRETGFARVTEALAAELESRYTIVFLGINYHGDPAEQAQRWRIYPADLGFDPHGYNRLGPLIQAERPAACLFVCDPWIGADYAKELAKLDQRPPCLLYTPVDASSLRPVDVAPLNQYAAVIAYTAFGAAELRVAGYTGPLPVIPHGIDLGLFHPLEQAHARHATGMPDPCFAVLVFDMNQPRKRLDIAFDAFARFAHARPDDVRLVYHGPLGGRGRWDISDMAHGLGIHDRLILPRLDGSAITAEQLSYLYSMCDVKLSTSSGEGWGLTTMEAMACGLPCICPDFAALGEWARPAAYLIPAPVQLRHVEINTVGRAPRPEDAAAALEDLYASPQLRMTYRMRGLELVRDPAYRWAGIADQFDALIQDAIADQLAPEPETVRIPAYD